MKTNMGNADRIIRTLIAVLIAVLYLSGAVTGTLAYILFAIGIVFLFTSIVGNCPLYTIIGIRTCRNHKGVEKTSVK